MGMNMVERRSYWSRAAVTARIVTWLIVYHGNKLPPPTDPPIAERILKWLALRGLARKEGGTWRPTPPMIHPADVIKVDE